MITFATDQLHRLVPNAAIIAQSTDLHSLEQIVLKGRATFVEVGLALARIKEAKLYASTHDSWEDYLRMRWRWSDRHARRLMVAAEMSVVMGPVPTERHARELSRLDDDESRHEALAEARVDAGGEPTVAQLRQSVEKRIIKTTKPKSIQGRRTPKWLFDALDDRFGPFVCDLFADAENALCEVHFSEEDNALDRDWLDRSFGNAPFELTTKVVQKAAQEAAEHNVRSTLLVPTGCSQAWFHEHAFTGTVYVPDMRISFDDSDGKPTGKKHDNESGADRDTMILCFGPGYENERAARARDEFRVKRLPLRATLEAYLEKEQS